MGRIAFLMLACCLYGQDLFHKAPPAVDEALRARISKFYQLHVDGSARALRQAEAMVAEDTKDYFYASAKPKYTGFEINRIDYSDDFTTAKAVVMVQRIVAMPGLTNKPMPWPEPSRWKLVNGEWYWYLSEDDLLNTPFGRRNPDNVTASTGAGTAPVIPGEKEMEQKFAQVNADKKLVVLDANKESTGQFVITNPLAGAITLTLDVDTLHAKGFEAHLDTEMVPSGGKAVVAVEWKPGQAPAPRWLQMVVRVSPTNVVIPLRVKFAADPQ